MDIDEIQIPHLATFSKAAELGSFTSAAKALGISQAAVSQRIQAMELTLKRSMFDRRGGRIYLTEAGRKVYEYARQILDLQRQVRNELRGYEAPVAGELVLAASSIPGEHLLPDLLSVFGRKHPQVHIRVAVSNSMRVMKQVERGEASLGFVGQKADNPHLEFQSLARDRLVLVALPNHPLGKRKTVTVDQLADHALILREVGSGMRHCFEKTLENARRSLSELRVALELGSNEAIKEAVLKGVGVAVLSRYAVNKELASGQLLALPVKGMNCQRDMFVVHDRRRVLPSPARLFLIQLAGNPTYHVAS